MADADDIPVLSPQTQASLQGLTRARHELKGWEHNLRQALVDDVAAGRLTAEQAEDLAIDVDLEDFKAPKADNDKSGPEKKAAPKTKA
jgi:hypothetical protein